MFVYELSGFWFESHCCQLIKISVYAKGNELKDAKKYKLSEKFLKISKNPNAKKPILLILNYLCSTLTGLIWRLV